MAIFDRPIGLGLIVSGDPGAELLIVMKGEEPVGGVQWIDLTDKAFFRLRLEEVDDLEQITDDIYIPTEQGTYDTLELLGKPVESTITAAELKHRLATIAQEA